MFADLGRVKHLKRERPGLVIGVGGCVASQEGGAIVARAPYVDLVFGPQTLHRLPELLAARRRTGEAAGRRLASRRSRNSTTCRRRASRGPPRSSRSWRAAASTAASASCPTPAARKSRGRSTTCSTEIADLAAQGVKEVTLLGQNVNAYRGRDGRRRATDRRLRAAPRIRRRNSGHRADPLHDLAPARVHAAADRRATRELPQARVARAPAGAVGLRPRPRGDEARLHRARVQVDRPRRCARRVRTSRISSDFIVGFPGETEARLRATHEARRARSASTARSRFVYSPRPGTPAAELPDETPPKCKLERLQRLQATLEAQARRISDAMVGSVQRVLVEGAVEEGRRRTRGPHRQQPRRELRRPPAARRHLRRRAHHARATARHFAARRACVDACEPSDPRLMKLKPVEVTLDPVDNQRLARLCGALDENLRQIEAALDVTIARRGERFTRARRARRSRARREALEHFYDRRRATSCRVEDIQLGLIESSRPGASEASSAEDRRAADAPRRPARPHAASDRVPAATSSTTTSRSASARPAPARPTWRWPARSTRSSATR